MRTCLLMTTILSAALAVGTVHAQSGYPSKPIRLIVPFPPGGPSDAVARMLAQKLTDRFAQPVVVDNRPGGGGTIRTETAVKAEPDGYTMIIVSAAYTANAALYKLTYRPLDDVTPIALIGEAANLVTLHPSAPIKSVKELIAYDRASPGKLNYGSGGTGGDTHLAAELFNQMAATRLTHIPYKGMGPALNDLLGGQIQLIFGNIAVMMPHVKANRLRGIAVTTAKRTTAAPEIGTVAEVLPGYEAVAWAAVLGPKGLPKDISDRWQTEVERGLRLSDVQERLAATGMESAGASRALLLEVLRRDLAKWQKVVRIAGIRPGS